MRKTTAKPTTKNRPRHRKLKVSELKVDPRVQRPLSTHRVNQISKNMDLDALGSLVISQRDNGDKVILDGQTRVAALKKIEFEDWSMDCLVYTGLSEEEEFGHFRRLNYHKLISAYDDFEKGVYEGDEECVAISNIVEQNGLFVARHSADGVVRCVSTLRKVFRTREVGPDALDFALHVAVSAWGATAQATESPVIRGLGDYYIDHNEDRKFSADAVAHKLSKNITPSKLIGQAKSLKEAGGGQYDYECVVRIVERIMNKHRRNGR